MNTSTIKTRKNFIFFLPGPSFGTILSLAFIFICMGLSIFLFQSHREYFPVSNSQKDKDADNDADAGGAARFFFNARKNITTNALDYPSMLAAGIADRAMNYARRAHSASAVIPVPNYNWMSMGPTNVGGRTRAILIDNTDPTHQTIFAGGVSGGIWKSTNGGGTWDNDTAAIAYSLNDTLSNLNVTCIAQDVNGVIYIGTGEGFSVYQQGEGFSTGMIGGGIFKSTDDGKTWQVLPLTVPGANKDNVTWAYVNRIAIRPDNPSVIYAATQGGLLVSHDGGGTWLSAYNKATSKKLSGIVVGSQTYTALDVKISADGSVVVACVGKSNIGTEPSTIGCYGYYSYPQLASDTMFTQIPSTGAGHLNSNMGRIEFAISPTDPNRIYASVIASVPVANPFQGNTSSGIFMTMNAKTNGGYWYDIGPGGSLSFDPYAEPGGGLDQAFYDNTLGVFPANEAQVLVGGTFYYEWSGANLSDTVGAWQRINHYFPYYAGDPLWIHADQHATVFDVNNPETVYFGCDGGIFKCTNMSVDPARAAQSIVNLIIEPVNRNYNVTQYYSICLAPNVNVSSVPVSINNGTATEQTTEYLGVGGGTQDNGSPYINGKVFNGYPNDGLDLSGGDGAGAVVSTLNPNVAYFCSDYGDLLREGNLGAIAVALSPTQLPSAYTKNIGDLTGGNIDSAWQSSVGSGGACFVFPVALYENAYDTMTHDSLLYTNSSDSSQLKGQTIWPISSNGNVPYPYVLSKTIKSGGVLNVPDRVVSRLAVGFSGGYGGGIWINGQGASNNVVNWIPIAGPLSKPTAFSPPGNSPVHALAWTPDGNTLFAGTEGGQLFRFTNINSVIANNYSSGALWFIYKHAFHPTGDTNINSTSLAIPFNGRDILSIAVDPLNGNNMLVTAGNYGQTVYMYYSNNALSSVPTFKSAQGNLPAMPVYSSILDILDSGKYISNSAMVATEHGIYTTTNITSSPVVWKKNSTGLPNVLSIALKQQTTKPWLCNNYGAIYLGTHGRGIWAANNGLDEETSVRAITASVALNNLLIYPNPMTTQGNIEFDLASDDNIAITIYDMQGKEVKTINMGNQSKGSHLVTFESTGLHGGTYFAALTGNTFRKVSKFVVIR